MHLRAVKLRGFKSFPDPVEVRLEPGVAVVVGPNGSGKSNVADAIVWAAGSLAPSELRAEKPDDVLFAGGAGRAAGDFCEVELLFDNTAGDGPVDYSELSVARRLHRGGEGQYLLNRTAVRRTDLVELLADLGLGSGMHSIIGQGRVEEVLASSPERRRELVEEAAGLGRFKRRRHRAELKLARVGVQVERARDLEEEVRKRLRPLALQATAAERAERLRGEVAALRARVAELDLAGCALRLEEWEERRAAVGMARRRADERPEAVLGEPPRPAEEPPAGPSADELRQARTASAAAERELEAAVSRLRGVLTGLAASARGERERRQAALIAVRGAVERLSVRREAAAELATRLRAELAEVEAARSRGGPPPEQLEREAGEAGAAARAAAVERDTLAERARLARERLAALEGSLAEREGLPPAARALAESGERLAFAGLRVEPGRERAIAAALGWRASALVADDPRSALALLERARAGGLGSVVVVVGDRAARLAQEATVVPADELLSAESLAVTPEGHGYDPATGELWFAGETAEAILLELEARKRALAGEAEGLDGELAVAAGRAAAAAELAERAERAWVEAAPFAGAPRRDLAGAARLAAGARPPHGLGEAAAARATGLESALESTRAVDDGAVELE